MSKTKSFEIPKIAVMQAYEKVKANKGAAGTDDYYWPQAVCPVA